MESYELYLFDIDGTLVDQDTRAYLPGVLEWFEQNRNRKIGLITNQGGVGLRLWMEEGGFGEPQNFPTEQQARAQIDAVNQALPGGPYPVFVCFAYQSKKSGKWAPIPEGCEDDPEWQSSNRKPAPGMLFRAIKEIGSRRDKTRYVGNGTEDRDAAANAEVPYQDADVFFGRVMPPEAHPW